MLHNCPPNNSTHGNSSLKKRIGERMGKKWSINFRTDYLIDGLIQEWMYHDIRRLQTLESGNIFLIL